ncbi:MAG: phosphopantetheine-binding protein, partial [Nostocales cyanobacterium ELA608]
MKQNHIEQCIVIPKEHKSLKHDLMTPINKYLVAYYTTTQAKEIDEEILLSYLSSKLPDYMIPSAFVWLEKFPLTINGKLDRKALPDKEFSDSRYSYVAPRNKLESKLCLIFAEVLGLEVDNIGIKDDFFRLGGNSILAIKLI